MKLINGKWYTTQELEDIVSSSSETKSTDDVLLSATIGALAGSTVVGGLIGGSFLGGFLGDVLEGTDDNWF